MREEAIRAYKKALELKPDFFGAYFNLGFLYSEQEAYSQAIPLFEKAMALKPQQYMPTTVWPGSSTGRARMSRQTPSTKRPSP